MEFSELVKRLTEKQEREPFSGITLAVDPGETTGLAIFQDLELFGCWEAVTKPLTKGIGYIHELLESNKPIDLMIYEDYRVYKWKTESHSWSELHTPKLIGALEALAYLQQIPTESIYAYQHKKFCTDVKLKEWGFYEKTVGHRHARDAVRIGAHHLLFGKDPKKF